MISVEPTCKIYFVILSTIESERLAIYRILRTYAWGAADCDTITKQLSGVIFCDTRRTSAPS